MEDVSVRINRTAQSQEVGAGEEKLLRLKCRYMADIRYCNKFQQRLIPYQKPSS
jgi:hypothetical protein